MEGPATTALVYAATHVTESWGIGLAIVHGFMVLAFGAQVYGLTLAYASVMLVPYLVAFVTGPPNGIVAMILVSTYAMTLLSSQLTAGRLRRARSGDASDDPRLVSQDATTSVPIVSGERVAAAEDHVIADRYRLGVRLGGGGFGVVYDAKDIQTGQPCAVKLFFARGGDDEARNRRFMREVELSARIESPYVVTPLDAGIVDGAPFLVMERLWGEDLEQRVLRDGSCSASEVAHYLRDVATGLDAAHALDIVHRDLKLANMFLTQPSNGRPGVKILDFGTAKHLVHDDGRSTTALMGTPVYMAPEQFGSAALTPAVDIYAFGMSAFHLLVGEHFYERERVSSANPFALSALLARGVPETATARAARYGREVPSGFDAWFRQCTALDVQERYATATEAVDALVLALDVPTSKLDTGS